MNPTSEHHEPLPSDPPRSRRRLIWLHTSALRWSAVGLLIFVVGLASGLYIMGKVQSQGDTPADEPVLYTVVSGSLGRTLQYPAMASWQVEGIVFAPSGGTITEISLDAAPLQAGDIVIRLDERPVIVVPGTVPAFRTLSSGIEGRDVVALNTYLADLGYGVDPNETTYGSETAGAVAEWQEEIGVPASGEVDLGDVLFVSPALLGTRPFRPAPDLVIGTQISLGSPLLEQLGGAPQIVIQLGDVQSDIGVGMPVTVSYVSGRSQPAEIAELRTEEGRTSAFLAGEGGEPLCEPAVCRELVPPSAAGSRVDVDIILVPDRAGPLVPAAALQTDAAGEPFVITADGRRRSVAIVVSAGGLSLVEGVQIGDMLRLP